MMASAARFTWYRRGAPRRDSRWGRSRTADKSNEITAIAELLEALDTKGSVITIDAMGCQRNIAMQIVQGGADYVLGVKDNQPGLAEAIRLRFDSANASALDRPFWDDL